jgi:hypothetical protein
MLVYLAKAAPRVIIGRQEFPIRMAGGADSLVFIWDYRSRNYFVKNVLKATICGVRMAAVPQLVGEFRFPAKNPFFEEN